MSSSSAHSLTLMCSAFLALAGCGTGRSGPVIPRSVLQGDWAFNQEQSQSLDSVAMGGRQAGAMGGGGMGAMDGTGGRGGRAGRGGGFGGGGGGSSVDPARLRALMQMLASTRARLSVEQSDTSVSLQYSDNQPMPMQTNGHSTKHMLAGLGEAEVKAEWKDGLLIVEQKFDGGIRLRSEYSRGPASPRLIVVTAIDGVGARSIAVRTVYDLVESDLDAYRDHMARTARQHERVPDRM